MPGRPVAVALERAQRMRGGSVAHRRRRTHRGSNREGACSELGLLPPPLWGSDGKGGGATKWQSCRRCRNRTTPIPNPSPQRGGGPTELAASTYISEHQNKALIAAATATVCASPLMNPVTCRPSGSPSSCSIGREIAGIPSKEAWAVQFGSPVDSRPSGAAAGADRL